MSNFVSMFDVALGHRSIKEIKSETGARLEFTDGVKPVDITGVVCAIEYGQVQCH